MKNQSCIKKLIGSALAFVMMLTAGFSVSATAQPLSAQNDWKTIAISPSGLMTYYVDDNNVLWGMGGRYDNWAPATFAPMLGDGISTRRTSFVPIMENVDYIAFVQDCPTT